MQPVYTLVFCIYISVIFNDALCRRIIGGRPAMTGEFPYQVSIKHSYNDQHICGGSIISSRHVLTAAHCLKFSWGGNYLPEFISVAAGQLTHLITEATVYKNVSKIIVHEEFNVQLYANDIALIELVEDLSLDGRYISAIPLNHEKLSFGRCTVTGWGYLEQGSGVISAYLMVADVYVVDLVKCQEMYDAVQVPLQFGMMCAGHFKGHTDACQGDSGGPLMCNGLLTGIVSTGEDCGSALFPGIYTDVAMYIPWIEKNTLINFS